MKSKKVAYILWLISGFGCLGFHRFYLGKIKTGFLWICTCGFVGIGSLLDLFSLGEQVKQVNSLAILEKLSRGEEITEFKPILGNNKKLTVETDSYCPYCMGILGRNPKRNTKCPFCSREIYVRPKQLIFDNPLLTKENAKIVDRLHELEKLGITGNDFVQKREALSEKFGGEVTSIDVVWSLIQETIQHTKDLGSLKKIYRLLALLLKELDKDCYYILYRSAKMQLLELQKDKYLKQVRIVSSGGNSCPSCQQLEGKFFSIEEALRLMPVPCKECRSHLIKDVSGFCQCGYIAET